MTGKPDLQAEAIKVLHAFSPHLEGHAQGEVFDVLIWLSARFAIAAAVLLDDVEPNHPRCPLCRSVEGVKATVHMLAQKPDGKPH